MMTLGRIFSANSRKVRGPIAAAALMAALLCVRATQAQTTALPAIVADFNHDGIPDVLVPSSTTATATIAFGAVPYGTFTTGAKAVTFPAGCSAPFTQGSLVVADFNRDGFPDIAFFCGSAAGVMLGNGDGTFGAPKLLDVASSQFAVLGDFNNDGKLDIALIGLTGDSVVTNDIVFLAGNGDGTFVKPVSSVLPQQGYSAPVAADIDGDGYLDIVLGSFNTDSDTATSVNVFGNNKDGTFGVLAQGINSPSVTATVSISAASSILAGNFLGNDVNDLIVPDNGTTPGLFLIQNTSTTGNFALGTPSKTAVAGLKSAVPGIFSGNGATDLFIANGTSISAYDNSGSGDFAQDYTSLTVAATSPLFAVADANLDGYADIYTASLNAGALQLAVDVTTGSATATSQPFSLGIGTKNVSATWSGNVNLLASTATGQQIVLGAVTATAVTSSLNPSTVGQSVTFTATVAPSIPTDTVPTGQVTISDGATVLGSGTLSGSGSFTFTTSTLTQATHLIKATYAGDSYFAASISPVLSQVVNHAPAVPSNLTWATPAAIVYGTALSATQLDAAAVDANGVAIPGTFAYTPAVGTILDAGAKTLSVTFTPTDLLSFLPATTTVTLTVTQAAPVLTWATPASIAYGIPLSATQLNAAVVGVTGTALPGTYTYTPATGSVLNPGAQTLAVSFVPTNAVDYTNATGSVKITVTGLTQASFTPTTATLGAGATTITVTGSGFVATSVVQVNGTPIQTTLVNPTTLTAVIPAADLLTVGTLQISVSDPTVSLTTLGAPFTITAPPPAATLSAPPMADPGTQPTITFAVTKTYPVDLSVTLNLAFASSTTPQVTNNQQLQLACQEAASNCVLNATNTTLTFIVPANTTTVPVILLQAGTIAGTITVPITLTAGGANVTPATLAPAVIVVPPAAPTVTGMTVTRSGDQLTVVMHGFSNTREVVNAKFHFTAAPGATLATTDLTLPADTIFNTDYYQMATSEAYGSTFTYTQIFNTSDGAANIGSVDATLTNTHGVSTPMTAQ